RIRHRAASRGQRARRGAALCLARRARAVARAVSLPRAHAAHGGGRLMSAYTRLVSGLVFPLHERIKGHSSVRRLHELEASQWWAPERVRELQLARLREFLARIGATVPFYESMFRARGFDPRSIDSVGALERLPLLSKPVIRAQ